MKKIKNCIHRSPKDNPVFDVNDEFWMLRELGSMSSEYVKKIVKEFEEVKSGQRERVDFGYESTFVQAYKPNHEKFPYQAFIDYNYGEDSLEIEFDDIYNLMKDWRDYLDEWEKETGLTKK